MKIDLGKKPQGQQEIIKICFTGGPCAGKTSGLAILADKLREMGYKVFSVPEAASMIFQSGSSLDLSGLSEEQ